MINSRNLGDTEKYKLYIIRNILLAAIINDVYVVTK